MDVLFFRRYLCFISRYYITLNVTLIKTNEAMSSMKFFLSLFFFFVSSAYAAPSTHDVEIKKFKFSPAEISIFVGDTIRWTNKEKRQYHSVWFEESGEKEPSYFFPDEFFEKTFDEAGDFPYRCGPHPKMTGIVHVVHDEKNEMAKTKEVAEVASSTMTDERRKEILHWLKHDCGSCHGMTLQGGLGPSLKPDALARMTETQVALTITHGRPGTPMPPWKPFFTEQETLWLARHLKAGTQEEPIKGKKENKE